MNRLERLLHTVAKHAYAGWEAAYNDHPATAESCLVEAVYAIALERPGLLEEALRAARQGRTELEGKGEQT